MLEAIQIMCRTEIAYHSKQLIYPFLKQVGIKVEYALDQSIRNLNNLQLKISLSL